VAVLRSSETLCFGKIRFEPGIRNPRCGPGTVVGFQKGFASRAVRRFRHSGTSAGRPAGSAATCLSIWQTRLSRIFKRLRPLHRSFSAKLAE
jgi:hypothetical protein